MSVTVVEYPGSNCDLDALHVVREVTGLTARHVWHTDTRLPADTSLVILPGGFSYGDYLRCGAIARFSPISKAVIAHAQSGGAVLGICNGFQILTEMGLLPGALIRNRGLAFICRDTALRVETITSPYTADYRPGQIVRFPIAHGEGCYYADDAVLDRLEREDRVAFRYVNNPNGSLRSIAGILSEGRNVLGLMPHPERAAEALVGGTDGATLFRSAARLLEGAR